MGPEVGDFDLAAELSGAIGGDELSLRTLAGTEEEGFEQVFHAFKSGIERELGDGDHEARYDLGIAYKEMGLLEDAIAAFQIAMHAPARQLACLHMLGLCALELKRAADAVAHFEQALSLPELPTDQRVPLRYDAGRPTRHWAMRHAAHAASKSGARPTRASARSSGRAAPSRWRGAERGEPERAGGVRVFDELLAPGHTAVKRPARVLDDVRDEQNDGSHGDAAEVVEHLRPPGSDVRAHAERAAPESDAARDPQRVCAPGFPPTSAAARRRRKISFVGTWNISRPSD